MYMIYKHWRVSKGGAQLIQDVVQLDLEIVQDVTGLGVQLKNEKHTQTAPISSEALHHQIIKKKHHFTQCTNTIFITPMWWYNSSEGVKIPQFTVMGQNSL